MPFPMNISPHAPLLDALFVRATILTACTFVLILAILGYCLIRFRARPGHKAAYVKGDSKMAVTAMIAFSILVFVGIDVHLAYYDHQAYAAVFGNFPDTKKALVVQVYAKQFEWNFRYPGNDNEFGTADDITEVNVLTVPANRDVVLQMRSLDVVHSLFFPHLRTKQDAVPGLTVAMWFHANVTSAEARQRTADENYVFDIACAELCGPQHSNMKGRLEVLPAAEYATWADGKSRGAANFDVPAIWSHWPADKDAVK